MRRVLIGEFGAIVRVGLAQLLAEAGCEVVPDAPSVTTLDRVVAAFPDVVLLDLDRPGEEELARSISASFPAMKVIAFSSDAPFMRIFPPFHGGESYVADLRPDLLVQASTEP